MEISELPLKCGALLCALIGALYSVLTWQLFAMQALSSSPLRWILPVYSLLAYAPIIAIIYPRLRAPRKVLLLGGGLVEIVVLGLFTWTIVDILMKD